jgi:methanogenic corrinoid protein MtbC1
LSELELRRIGDAVVRLDEEEALRLVKQALDAGSTSLEVTRAVEKGMQGVGERYERQDIFLSGLIMAGEIFRGAMELTGPGLEGELESNASGKVLLGTVEGDIHDIGKNLALLAFRSFGFTVKDLGVNVPPQAFLEAALSYSPDIVGLSGLLSTAFDSMRNTVALLRQHESELERRPIVIIGGGTIDMQVSRHVGCDYWTTDAMAGVRMCREHLESRGN